MKHLFTISLFLLSLANLFGQKKTAIDFSKGQHSIYFARLEAGKPDPEASTIILTIEGGVSVMREHYGEKKMISQMPTELGFLISDSAKYFQTAILQSGAHIMMETPVEKLPKLELTDRKDTVLGFECEVYTTNIRSNRVDVSVFKKSNGIKSSPIPSLGISDGIAMRIVINGNTEIKAFNIVNNIASQKLLLSPKYKTLPSTMYRAKISESYITTIPIFKNQQLCFDCVDSTIQNDLLIYNVIAGKGTVVLKRVAIPKLEKGLLFAELTEISNGDAYDRTGSVFMIPDDLSKTFLDGCRYGVDKLPFFIGKNGKKYQGVVATENYEPIVELIRFYTPFGVHHFNTQVAVDGLIWADSAFYKQDITPLMPYLKEYVWVGAFIGNYDKGGHKINLTLKHYPDSKEVVQKQTSDIKYWFKPLFCTNNVLEMAGQEYATMFDNDTLAITFNIPENISNLKLRYISTGHGGWDGGDEFNPKENEIFIDGAKIAGYIPWRSDCGTYRLSNPASGNFWNGTSSSDYSRSGWCPGTATNPIDIPIPSMSKGQHILKIAINQGKSNGSSFSAWNISGILIGEQK